VLGVPPAIAAEIVDAFDDVVAKPLQANLSKKKGRDLAKRNPLIYTARGTTTVDEWVDRALADWETSAIEGHIGTWMEEVARIVSGGFKPGSGVDLQIQRQGPAPVTELYAIQAAPNTKSAGGSRSDVDSLRQAAGALRAGRRIVELYVAVLHGRPKTAALRKDPSITKLASDDFWLKVSGIPDFRQRLLEASMILASLVQGRALAEVARIKAEAAAIFGDAQGILKLDVLANPPTGRSVKSNAPNGVQKEQNPPVIGGFWL
jgi:Type II restriction endonuclease EcoO109I